MHQARNLTGCQLRRLQSGPGDLCVVDRRIQPSRRSGLPILRRFVGFHASSIFLLLYISSLSSRMENFFVIVSTEFGMASVSALQVDLFLCLLSATHNSGW